MENLRKQRVPVIVSVTDSSPGGNFYMEGKAKRMEV